MLHIQLQRYLTGKHIRKILNGPYINTFGSYGLIQISGLLNSIILARTLGPQDRGEFAAAILLPTLLVSFGALGLYEAALYHVAHDKRTIESVATVSLLACLILGTVSMAVGFLVIPVVLGSSREEVITIARWALILIPFGMLHSHSSTLLRSLLQMKTYNLLQLIVPIGSAGGALILGLLGNLNLSTAVLLQLSLFIFASLVSFVVMIVRAPLRKLNFDRSIMTSMLAYGVRVYLGNIFVVANARLDQLILIPLISAADLGYYVIAVKVAEISGYLAAVVVLVGVPRIAAIADKKIQLDSAVRLFGVHWWVSLLVKLVFIPLVVLLIPIIYGQQFMPAIPAAIILVVASVFHDGKRVLTGVMQALDHPWPASKSEFCAVIITIALLPLAIPHLGILGAAVVSMIAYGIALLLLSWDLVGRYQLTVQKLFHFPFSIYSNRMQ